MRTRRLSLGLAGLVVWMAVSAYAFGQAPAAPPPVDLGPLRGSDVTLPKLISEVKPAYTDEAMRLGIEGTVLLECVLEKDGSVGKVKVLRSLDPGLDAEAVKAARQWRFSPAAKAGSPVRVAVNIEMKFTLRKGSDPGRWPSGFTAETGGDWVKERAEESAWRFDFRRPPNWTVEKAPGPARAFLVRVAGEQGVRIASALRPSASQTVIDRRLPGTNVRPLVEAIEKGLSSSFPTGRIVETGRVDVSEKHWIWYDMESRTLDAATTPAEFQPLLQTQGGLRRLVFVTTVKGQEIVLVFSSFFRQGLSVEERDAELLAASHDFRQFMDGLSIEIR